MSELQLTTDLMKSVKTVMEAHDPEVKDPVLYAQYLAAMVGATIAELKAPVEELRDLVNQLNAFTHHVFDEQSQQAPEVPEPERSKAHL